MCTVDGYGACLVVVVFEGGESCFGWFVVGDVGFVDEGVGGAVECEFYVA